jgi:uncharacterized RDD family membrane protein YckC
LAAAARIETAVHVEIPEDVRLSFPLAGPAPRLAAYAIDLTARAMVFLVFVVLVSVAIPGTSLGGTSIGLALLALFVLEWGYGFLFEMLWNGQTPGKRAFGLRVVKEGGYAIGPYDAMVRNLLRAADVLPFLYGVGLVSMLATRRLQRLGDIAAGTMVIRETRHRLRREIPDLAGVRKLSADELGSSWRPTERTLDLLYLFALRRESLAPARAREIATLLAAPLRRRLALRTPDRDDPDTFLLRVLRTFHQARS